MHHAVGILIRMEPPESETFPDVLLTLDTEEVEIHKDLLNEIERGQKIGNFYLPKKMKCLIRI